jgi:aspartate 1-decarboxylase
MPYVATSYFDYEGFKRYLLGMSIFNRKMLLAKIHGATVTQANVAYEGSITIPQDILETTGLLQHEAVAVWDVSNGARFETYILKGAAGSREFHVNGAAAHLVSVGDRIIIAGFGLLPYSEAATHNPKVLFMAPDNSIRDIRSETPSKVIGD